MHECTALVAIRPHICHRLREMPYDPTIERPLVRLFGTPEKAERQVAERTCYMVAMLALDSVPEMRLAEDPRRWAYTEEALEAVAHTFPPAGGQLTRIAPPRGVMCRHPADRRTVAKRMEPPCMQAVTARGPEMPPGR